MNWSTVALLFFAWQMLSQNKQSSPKLQDVAPFLSDETKDILDGVAKLSSTTATNEDKTGAILQMMTNPTVINFAQNLFGSKGADKTPDKPNDAPSDDGLKNQNDEGYTFGSPTERAKQFFAPVDAIATAEIKHKLCYFYDNWYLAK